MSGTDDKGEFGKFTKFFTIRLVQAVVQSRLGQKVSTQCSVLADPSDWFNIQIEELGEVTSHIRAAIDGRYPPEAACICLDFQLQTSDGDQLPMESWAIGFDPTKCDPNVGVRTHLYHQLGSLLKSAISASRVTPVYRNYSRRQGPDSFVVCYQVYEGAPNLDLLGDDARSVRLGNLTCPYGTLTLDLHYRTKMVIYSGETGKKVKQESSVSPIPKSPLRPVKEICSEADAKTKAAESTLTPPDPCQTAFSVSPSSGDVPWFGATATSPTRRHSVAFQVGITSGSSSDDSSNVGRPPSNSELNPKGGSSGALFRMDMSTSSGGSFSKPSSLPEAMAKPKDTFPFSALLSASSAPTVTRQSSGDVKKELPEVEDEEAQEPVKTLPEPKTSLETHEEDEDSSDDSFVKVDIGLFSSEQIGSDLGSFVRECKTAPPDLRSFELPSASASLTPSEIDPCGSLEDIQKQLAQFNDLQPGFTEFLRSLQIDHSEEDED